MEFRIVIWNIRGLSQNSDPDRLRRAKEAFRILADENTAAFALVELAPRPDAILEDLSSYLGNEWMPHYGATGGRYSEIGLLLNRKRLSATTVTLNTNPHHPTGEDIKLGRKPAGVFQIHYNGRPSFLLAVIHFKAESGGSDFYMRKSLAAWLKRELEGLRHELEEFYSNTPPPVVIVGDFNGEPWEEMFREDGFRAFRHVEAALRSKKDDLQLYNPMWRLLPDPASVPVRRANTNQKSVPYGTFPEEIWHSLIDGILVSGEWLTSDSNYVLHDERLEILTDGRWHHVGKQGAHHARPLDIAEASAKELAITDHLPIAVNLEII